MVKQSIEQSVLIIYWCEMRSSTDKFCSEPFFEILMIHTSVSSFIFPFCDWCRTTINAIRLFMFIRIRSHYLPRKIFHVVVFEKYFRCTNRPAFHLQADEQQSAIVFGQIDIFIEIECQKFIATQKFLETNSLRKSFLSGNGCVQNGQRTDLLMHHIRLACFRRKIGSKFTLTP